MAFFPETFPRPWLHGEDAGFWEAARTGVLALQRCADCHTFRHPPAPLCFRCRSQRKEFVPVAGTGTVVTYTIVHQELLPEMREAVPYNVAVVAPDGIPDVHLITNVVGVPNELLRVGLPVEVVFEDAGDGVMIPRFRPR